MSQKKESPIQSAFAVCTPRVSCDPIYSTNFTAESSLWDMNWISQHFSSAVIPISSIYLSTNMLRTQHPDTNTHMGWDSYVCPTREPHIMLRTKHLDTTLTGCDSYVSSTRESHLIWVLCPDIVLLIALVIFQVDGSWMFTAISICWHEVLSIIKF